MGISQQRKDEVQRKRKDNKLKPTFAPGQGDTNMRQSGGNMNSPLGGGGNSPFGGGGNQPSQGNSPFGGGGNQPNQGSSPFGANKTPQVNSPFGNQPPQGNSPFGNQPPQSNSPFGGNQLPQGNSPFGGGNKPPMAGGFGSTQQPNMLPNQGQNPQDSQLSTEDKLGKVLETSGKASLSFFKELASSLKVSTILDYKRGLNNTFISSSSLGGLSIVLGLFKHSIFNITLACVCTAGLALGANFIIVRSPKYKELTQLEPEVEPEPASTSPFGSQQNNQNLDLFDEPPKTTSQFGGTSIPDNDEDEDGDIDDFDSVDFDDEDDEEEDDLFDDDFEDDEEEDEPKKPTPKSDWKTSLPTASVAVTPIIEGDPEKALSALENMDKDMVSRQFIYESMLSACQKITPDYTSKKVIDDSSDKFNTMDAMFSDIFTVLGIPDDDIKNLNKYTETLLVDYLEVERSPKKYKLEDFDQELTQMLRKGYDGQGGDSRMFSKSEFIGKKMITRIFKGVAPMISIGDVLKNNQDFYLDTSKGIPLIIGINDEGKDVKLDLEEAESILISGKPRSGKSFTVRSILSQMVFFNSPDKISLYFGDVKGASSDYFNLNLPHVRAFESKPLDILNMMEKLVYKEANRRSKAFEDAGVIKIKDYHDKYPERTDMPYIYLVLDEMVGLASELKKMTAEGDNNTPKYQAIYFGYLEKLVTQLPAYGIRLLAIPHRITNNIIPKTASDNMMFKMAVAADEELLKETLNVTQKKFGYRATNKGDLSVLTSIISPEPFYCRSVVPAQSTSTSDKFFDFQANFWNKLTVSDNPEDKESTPLKSLPTSARGTSFDYSSENQVSSTKKYNSNLDLTDENGESGVSFDDLF